MSQESFEIPTIIKVSLPVPMFLALQALLQRVASESEIEEFVRDQLLSFEVLTPEEITVKLAEQIEPDLGNKDLMSFLDSLESAPKNPELN